MEMALMGHDMFSLTKYGHQNTDIKTGMSIWTSLHGVQALGPHSKYRRDGFGARRSLMGRALPQVLTHWRKAGQFTGALACWNLEYIASGKMHFIST